MSKQPTRDSPPPGVVFPPDVHILIRDLHRAYNVYCDTVKTTFLEEEPDSHKDFDKRVEVYRAYVDARHRANLRLADFGWRYIYDQYKQRFMYNQLPDVTKDLSE